VTKSEAREQAYKIADGPVTAILHPEPSEIMMTAKNTFNRIADLVASNLQPEGRAQAIASTLRQIGEIAGEEPILPEDVQAALNYLSTPKDGDDAPISARRRTCAEIATLLAPASTSPGFGRYAVICLLVADAFDTSTDPRQQAMAKTATREAEELREWMRTYPSA
jgi:hypothetical protein